jgi:uracil-DNA glycosylase family 4
VKVIECDACSLCKSRLHASLSQGSVPANVFIVFGQEPKTNSAKDLEREFIHRLHSVLQRDWYKTYAIKCAPAIGVTTEHINACRKWLKIEIRRSNPYLVILMGNFAKISVLGSRFQQLPQNVFYSKNKRKYFIGENINGNPDRIKRNLNTILQYIREFYG